MSLNGAPDQSFVASVSPRTGLVFDPPSGPIGTLVTLSGADFSSFQAASLGGGALLPVHQSAQSLLAFLMPGVSSGPISVNNLGGSSLVSVDSFLVTNSQFLPNGIKISGWGFATGSSQGGRNGLLQGGGVQSSIALSADGNTAIMGGSADNNGVGAAWIFTRGSNRLWNQQGSKLVGSGAAGQSAQGSSVAISADGNTALVGGYSDHSGAGATWVFTRSDGVWTQQGTQLVGSGFQSTLGILGSAQGLSVALSADGNTAAVGGPWDNGGAGATWIFTRNNGVWTQQGSKLVGSGAVIGAQNANINGAQQGSSLAISADGNTVLVGGMWDNSWMGAAWVFTRSSGVWTQQGQKLVGANSSGSSPPFSSEQGASVALSADGNVALVGGINDTNGIGAAWIFTRYNGHWTQQQKLTPPGAIGQAYFGVVSLSADGHIAFIGGGGDRSGLGAAWVFNTSGSGTWTQQGGKYVGSNSTIASGPVWQGYGMAMSLDGTTGAVCGPGDSFGVGACWIYSN